MRAALDLLAAALSLALQDATTELNRLVAEIQAGVPQREGADGDRERRAYFLASRTKLAEFAAGNAGSQPGLLAQMRCGTLALAADDKALAARDLEPVVEATRTADAGELLSIRIEALEWLAQAAPARARAPLAAAAKLAGSPGRVALRILRRLDAEEQLRTGKPAIPFRAKDLQGAALSPEALRGRVLVLQFWSSTSVDCMREMPTFKAAYRELHDRGLEIVGVCLDKGRIRTVPGGREPAGDGAAGLARFVSEFEMPWPQIYDGESWDGDVAQLYAVTALPKTIVVDRKGVIRAVGISAAELRAKVAELIAEK